MRNLDKFKACLLGGAAGDALGFVVEFCSEDTIFARFGKRGITEYCLREGIAQISDDTQMTLFTANGLLLWKKGDMREKPVQSCTISVYRCYQEWLRTQTEPYPVKKSDRCAWLANLPELFSRRAPGNTCLSALESSVPGSTANPINHSKGCGGVMRVAPIGLYFCDSPYSSLDSDRLGAEAAALTHGHELGWLPAAVLVHMIRRLVENEQETILHAVLDSMEAIRRIFPKSESMETLMLLLRKAVELSKENGDDLDAIHQLGQGWVAEETLAIAVFCALKHSEDFDQALISAVNHGGDSDSTGAVTGNILGASLGLRGIPQKYLDNLELREVILGIADDLYRGYRINACGESADPLWEDKYVRACYPNAH